MITPLELKHAIDENKRFAFIADIVKNVSAAELAAAASSSGKQQRAGCVVSVHDAGKRKPRRTKKDSSASSSSKRKATAAAGDNSVSISPSQVSSAKRTKLEPSSAPTLAPASIIPPSIAAPSMKGAFASFRPSVPAPIPAPAPATVPAAAASPTPVTAATPIVGGDDSDDDNFDDF
jgi:hypothetical protein